MQEGVGAMGTAVGYRRLVVRAAVGVTSQEVFLTMGTAPSPAPPSLNPLNLAVTFKDGPVVVTDPTLAWLSEAQVSEDETVGVGVNEDEYNGELHLTRNSPAVSSLSIVIVIVAHTNRITKAVI